VAEDEDRTAPGARECERRTAHHRAEIDAWKDLDIALELGVDRAEVERRAHEAWERALARVQESTSHLDGERGTATPSGPADGASSGEHGGP
jgi:hypothetical protein